MRKLITVLLTAMLLIASSAYANCFVNQIDVNNKFLAAMALLDVIKIIESDEKQIKLAHQKSGDTDVDMLIAYKQENIDFICAIKQLDKFDVSIKNNIKVGLSDMREYLRKKVQFNLDLLDLYNNDKFSDLNKFKNKVADLAIIGNSLNEELMNATPKLIQVIQYEEIDDTTLNVPNDNGKFFKQIWVTDNERTILIKRFNEFKDTDNMWVLFGLGLFVKHISYKNKDLETMDVIKIKYKK
jgi:hypothetical protein